MQFQGIKGVAGTCLCAMVMSATASGAIVQWRVEDGGNGHTYETVRSASRVTWEQARDLAVGMGGHLATLTSASEDAFVFGLVSTDASLWNANTFGGPWLGGYQPDPTGTAPDQGWVWVTGEQWSFTNWSPGEPGDQGWLGGPESYLQYRDFGGGWNDFTNDGNATYSFVVEYSIPGPASIALFGMSCAAAGRRRVRSAR